MEAKKYDKALNTLNKAIKIDVNNSVTHYLFGLVEARQERYKEAIIHLKKSVSLNPESDQYKFDLALCYVETEEYDKSEKIFDELIDAFPYDQSLFVYVSDLYERTEQYRKGLELIESIPEDELGEPYLVYQLAKFHNMLDTGKDKVITLLEEAKEKAEYLRDKKLIEDINEYKDQL